MLFKSSIGIEINDLQVNIVYLKGSFRGMNLAVESCCQLDAGKSRHDRQSDIVSFINSFIREKKITASDIFLGIAGNHSMIREIDFPLAVKENLRTTLAYEIEKYLPISPNDIYFDYHIISESKDEQKLKLLLVAVKKDVFEYYLDIAEQIDQGISGIEIIPAALANYSFYHQETQQDTNILLYLRDSGVDAVVLKQRAMVYAKSIAVAETPDDKPAFWDEQLIRLRDIFCPEGETVRVILYGILPSDDLFHKLSKEFQNITCGKMHAVNHSEQFIPAFGLALEGMQKVPIEMNLMPVPLRKKPNKSGIYVMLALAGLLALAGVVWAGSHLVIQRQILQSLDAELARLSSETSVVEKIQSETRQMKKDIMYFQSLQPGNAYVIEVAEELSNIIPTDAWLSDLKLAGNELSLYGTAASSTGLISLLDKSPLFEDVKFISAIRKDKDGKEVFRIGCKIHAR